MTHSEIKLVFAGVDVSADLAPYIQSLTYTDNEEDEADDLQIKLQDASGIWIDKWLPNSVLGTYGAGGTQYYTTPYKVTATAGVHVRSEPSASSRRLGYLVCGAGVDVIREEGEFFQVLYSGGVGYAEKKSLAKGSGSGKWKSSAVKKSPTGLVISAAVAAEGFTSEGRGDVLELPYFLIDSIDVSGPPTTVTIKATSTGATFSLKNTKKSRAWRDIEFFRLMQKIADENGVPLLLTDSAYRNGHRFRYLLQNNCSDIAFVKAVCKKEGLSVKFSNNILIIYKASGLEGQPVIFDRMTGGYTSFKLKTDDNDTYTSCRVSYTSTNGNTYSGTAYVEDYDESDEDNVQLNITNRAVASDYEARQLAAKLLEYYNKFQYTASFTVPGDPRLVAGARATLNNFGLWNGSYIISKAKHSVGVSGYTTQVDLRKA